ncbi:lipopolysaccharide biosynthesis protein [Odoribacter splanchnicus]|uniref:lipopolysaccharide biosynthesis protein n=1 Tax=Odoribacter splanchnicus TaxID=28118 RepID=UPI0034B79E64
MNIFYSVFRNKFTQDFLGYIIITGLQKAIPFLLLPYLSRLFNEEQLGYYVLFQTILLLLYPILTIGFDTAIGINYYKLDTKKFAIYLTNGLGFIFFFAAIGIGLFFLLPDFISRYIKFSFHWLIVIAFIPVPQFIFLINQSLLRYLNLLKAYGCRAITFTLLSNTISLMLIFFTSYTWEAFIIGTLAGYMIMSTDAFFQLKRRRFLSFKYEKSDIKDALKVGLPICIHSIGGWLGNSLNKVMVNSLIGIGATASFGIGSAFGMVMTMLQDSMNLAYTPYIYQKLKQVDNEVKDVIVKLTFYLYLIIIALVVGISIVGYFSVEFFFGDNYSATRSLIFPLVLAAGINGLYKIHTAYIFFSRRTLIIAKITFITGVINIVCSYFLIEKFGISGAAYAAVMIQLLIYLLTLYSANKLFKMDWKLRIRKLITKQTC